MTPASTFRRGDVLAWAMIDAGYRQTIEKGEIRRFELHLSLVALRAQRPPDAEPQALREYKTEEKKLIYETNQVVRQVAAWQRDHAAWLAANPEPEPEPAEAEPDSSEPVLPDDADLPGDKDNIVGEVLAMATRFAEGAEELTAGPIAAAARRVKN